MIDVILRERSWEHVIKVIESTNCKDISSMLKVNEFKST